MTNTATDLKDALRGAEAVLNWCLKSEAAPRVNAMLDLARSEEGIPVLPADLDRDPWVLNCPNGTLDLRTGKLREHRREDYLTKLCPTEYLPGARCPTWLAFLSSIFAADGDNWHAAQELIIFVQRLLGCCLTGSVQEHILPILWGTGANGKSTLINVLLEMLGRDYSMKAPPNLLMARRGESHPTERADLFGKRLVVCSETPQGRRLDESLVKDLTGGEPIRARRMREDFWEFLPTHKVFLVTNHKPIIQGTDEGIRRRLRLIPFTVTFWDPADPTKQGKNLTPELRQDKGLLDKLRAELPGILAWCVQGCLAWQRDGLTLPETVKGATSEYLSSEDLLEQFLEECCVRGSDDLRCRSSDLYARFQEWCEAAGEKTASRRSFGEAMTERGFQRVTSNGVWYLGVALQSETDPLG